MKKITGFLILFVLTLEGKSIACTVCQDNQPKILKNISHGTGAQSNFDYIIICISVVIVSITLFLSIKYLIRPEKRIDRHIKNIVVE